MHEAATELGRGAISQESGCYKSSMGVPADVFEPDLIITADDGTDFVLVVEVKRYSDLQVLENREKEVVDRLGNGDLAAVRPDEFGVAPLDQATEVTDLRLLPFRFRDLLNKKRRLASLRAAL